LKHGKDPKVNSTNKQLMMDIKKKDSLDVVMIEKKKKSFLQSIKG
jgi:hypothetical protein